MPTVLTHAVVAGAAVKALSKEDKQLRLWLTAVALSVLPDADVIGFYFGVRYGDFFGHRGFFHSPFFALILSVFCVAILFRNCRPFSWDWYKLVAFFFALGSSHGLLDAMTDGGLGIALLSPFNNARYFFGWAPIPVSPIGAAGFRTPRGLQVITWEVLFLWIPLLITLGAILTARRFRQR